MPAYVTPAEFLLRYDARTTGDLVNDTGDQQTALELATNDVLLMALSEASGTVESALASGGTYTTTELAAVITEDGNQAEQLRGIVSDVAALRLVRRRYRGVPDDWKPLMEEVERLLKAMRAGDAVLLVPSREDANIIETVGPTIVEFGEMNLMRDRSRCFPARQPTING